MLVGFLDHPSKNEHPPPEMIDVRLEFAAFFRNSVESMSQASNMNPNICYKATLSNSYFNN